MSNQNVGQVYAQIIRDVVDTSRLDFEEGGVDESVLEELGMGWQRKLSQLGVAQFPWDPKPEPAQVNTPTVAPNYPQIASPAQTAFSIPPLPVMQPMADNSNGPHIKTEPSLDGGLHLPSYGGHMTAQQRAAQNLAATFGPRAAASISAIQTGIPQQTQQGQQQSQQQQQQRQGISAQRPPLTQSQYQQAIAMQAAQHRSQIQSQGSVNGAQTDGSGDTGIDALSPFTRVNSSGQEVQIGRVEIDRMIRQKIEAKSHSMEGGGLMLPLKESYSDAGRKKLKTNDSRAVTPVHGFVASRTPTANLQYDGVGDDNGERVKDEELDEDAINSELDDSDEGGNEEEDDDDSMGNIMLCMYDKVQRVKNKWKCVMKDGVLTVNGREYVFHKATGEYEW